MGWFRAGWYDRNFLERFSKLFYLVLGAAIVYLCAPTIGLTSSMLFGNRILTMGLVGVTTRFSSSWRCTFLMRALARLFSARASPEKIKNIGHSLRITVASALLLIPVFAYSRVVQCFSFAGGTSAVKRWLPALICAAIFPFVFLDTHRIVNLALKVRKDEPSPPVREILRIVTIWFGFL